MLLVAGLSGLDRFPPRLENTIDPPPFLHSPPPLFLPPRLPFSFRSYPRIPSIAFRRFDRGVLDGSTMAIPGDLRNSAQP